MDYFNILNLSKEPFSNSPDPEFFFNSRQHLDCLQKLELSLLLRRGLNVIIGDVGTGKTTMCRQIIRRFSQKNEIETHLILDPYFLNATEFLATITEIFLGKKPPAGTHEGQLKEYIKQYLFQKGVDQNKTTALIIDEGQKIPVFCLEILRELLNYETNDYKLLQIVIFAQKEFEHTIRKYPNFADRINLYHLLKPLNYRDTRLMIKFRLEKSSNSPKKLNLFSHPALWKIYRITGGYPRKIINLCHQCILTMIIQNRTKIGYHLVRACARRMFADEPPRWKKISATAVVSGAAAAILLFLLPLDRLNSLYFGDEPNQNKPAFTQKGKQESLVPDSKSETPVVKTDIVSNEVYAQPTEIQPSPETVINAEESEKAVATAPVVASVETPTRDDAQNLKPESRYSDILGTVTLKRYETLSLIIQRVYGDFNSKYFKLFIKANPDIMDPDRVVVGQMISVPAIPVNVTSLDKSLWWVKIDETDSLEAAFNLLREHPDGAHPVRMIPYWNSKNGTRFALVLKKLFADERSARDQLEQLPADLSSNGMILSLFDENSVFFADPFFGRTQ